jgi:hypothetical protein
MLIYIFFEKMSTKSFGKCKKGKGEESYSLFLSLIMALHWSAYSHQSRQDCTPRLTVAPQLSHSVSSSSLQIST